ncbi:type VII secretion integral membrane protein EccD [Nocardia sp. NPDC005998]|uniref:type VII secretion integral membrane protein EccD n=1 Tax=Nocardia sp. NPDC005998 TaxID=3156894 RepID=UPI0033A1CA03
MSVIGGDTQLDVGLPVSVPIASFIGELVALIGSRTPDLGDSDEDTSPAEAQHWTLARLGREAIPPSRTLTEAEVRDGNLLVLRAVGAKESPALFDDVIDAVSRLTTVSFRGWSPSAARWTGLVSGVIAVGLAALLLTLVRANGAGWVPSVLSLGVGVAALTAAAIAARRYSDTLSAVWLALSALVLFFSGAALLAPGSLGSPHLLLAFSVTLVAAAVGYRATGVGTTLFSLVITVCLIGMVISAVRMIWDPALPKIAAGMSVGALILLSMVPRLAALLARLPVPPVPTAGAAIDPADHEPSPTIEGIGAIGATALPSAVGLGRRAEAANQYQTGLLGACTIAAVFGGVGAADTLGGTRWQGLALAVILAIILALRGRSFADLTQAGTLIAGGAVTFAAVVAGVALGNSYEHPGVTLVAAVVLLVFAAATVAFGVIGPHVEITPIARRVGEIFEYLLIILVIPLVLWIMGVYSMARNI